jgi:hypothetical protein
MKGGRSLKMNGGCINSNTLMMIVGLLVLCVIGYYLFTMKKMSMEKFFIPELPKECNHNQLVIFNPNSYLSVKNPVDNFNVIGKNFTIEFWLNNSRTVKENMFFENDVIGLGIKRDSEDPNAKSGVWKLKFNGKISYIYDKEDVNSNLTRPPGIDDIKHVALSVEIQEDPTKSKVYIAVDGNVIRRNMSSINKEPSSELTIGNKAGKKLISKLNYNEEYLNIVQIAGFKFTIDKALYTQPYAVPSINNPITDSVSFALCTDPISNTYYDKSNNQCEVSKYGEIKVGRKINY